MTIKAITKMGNPVLSTPSLLVEDVTNEDIAVLLQDMYDTMQDAKGVGIAAPQINCNKRVIIFGFENNDRYPPEYAVPFTILINPTIEILDHTMIDDWEGCLSIPGMRGKVPRYKKLKYTGFDLAGNEVNGIAEGYHARVIQHECDHIDGFLYPQRIKDLCCFGFEEEVWEKMVEDSKK